MEVQIEDRANRRFSRNVTAVFSVFVLVVQVSVWNTAEPYTETDVKNGGTVTGIIKFVGEFPKRESAKVDRDPATCGASQLSEEFLVDPESKGLRNGVATLLNVESGKRLSAATPVTLIQKDCRYIPHVQVAFLSAGDPTRENSGGGVEIRMLNSDNVFHNVHALDEGDETTFNVPSLPGKNDVKSFTAPGRYKIRCDMHSWMSAWVIVADQPYVAVSGTDGSFRIEDVPPGDYKLRMWHEGLGSVERDVKVRSNEETFVDFTIGGGD